MRLPGTRADYSTGVMAMDGLIVSCCVKGYQVSVNGILIANLGGIMECDQRILTKKERNQSTISGNICI